MPGKSLLRRLFFVFGRHLLIDSRTGFRYTGGAKRTSESAEPFRYSPKHQCFRGARAVCLASFFSLLNRTKVLHRGDTHGQTHQRTHSSRAATVAVRTRSLATAFHLARTRLSDCDAGRRMAGTRTLVGRRRGTPLPASRHFTRYDGGLVPGPEDGTVDGGGGARLSGLVGLFGKPFGPFSEP